MNWNDLTEVSPAKVQSLREKLSRLGIELSRIDEQFTKGGGPGGQKINKTANRVVLRYAPLELTVRCQRERRRSLNRFLALRELADQIEMKISPDTSDKLKEWNKLRKQKDRRARRSALP
jgi:protein subunit release factor B